MINGVEEDLTSQDLSQTFSYVSSESVSSNPDGIVIGRDFRIEYGRLQNYCARHLSEIEVDLIIVLGSVAVADRRSRRRARKWHRSIQLTVPMHEPGHWRKQQNVCTLQEALGFLTGDSWSFEFVHRHRADVVAQQLPLLLSARPAPVIP